MKVIIDLIEDIRTAIDNNPDFTLTGMALQANEKGEHEPIWQSNIVRYRLDNEAKKLFMFLGQDDTLTVGALLQELNTYSNEAMMYEVCITFTQDDQRQDKSLIGFGEAIPEKKYLLFIDVNA
jgi:hypothetical protein